MNLPARRRRQHDDGRIEVERGKAPPRRAGASSVSMKTMLAVVRDGGDLRTRAGGS